MQDFWKIMGPAVLGSLLLSPIHCLFGLHIVRRGVIFIDLAVAQVAALGTAFAISGGYEPTDSAAYWISLGFGLVAALLIAFTRFKLRLVPHEAIIGIIFVVGSAWSIIALSGSSHGLEEMQNMLVGNVLTVGMQEVTTTAKICTGILLVLLFMWRAFTSVSMQETEKTDLQTVLYDCIFYSLLALLVASAVKMAGVLLVFTWLVMPAVIAFFWAQQMRAAVAIALPTAILGSLAGLWLSYGKDWPTGATMVVVFGGLVAVCYAARLLVPEKKVNASKSS
jgi:zinc/manganese transport system permease protein